MIGHWAEQEWVRADMSDAPDDNEFDLGNDSVA
jgi:hypothetical protein